MKKERFIYKIKNGTMVIIDKKDNVLIRDKYRACDYLNKLNNENEELKQFQEKVFAWIDKEISQNEEAIEWGEKQGADVGAMGFYINMLKMFQKDFTDGQYNK